MQHTVVQRIVVGVDGSAASHEAVRWAVQLASAARADLEVIHAWTPPDMGTERIDAALAEPADLEREARRELQGVLAGVDESGLVTPLKVRVLQSDAVAAILDAGRAADLIVVGQRGLSGRPDEDPEDVCGRLVRAADCPVVVVPA
jgi:nucleotide-binding universal stress UspA family protein